jgi:hypothetical protein
MGKASHSVHIDNQQKMVSRELLLDVCLQNTNINVVKHEKKVIKQRKTKNEKIKVMKHIKIFFFKKIK